MLFVDRWFLNKTHKFKSSYSKFSLQKWKQYAEIFDTGISNEGTHLAIHNISEMKHEPVMFTLSVEF